MANITTRQTQAPEGQPQVTVAAVPLSNTQLDTNFINLNTELVNHKYHSFTNDQYYFDNYEQGNYFRLFTENAVSDNTRFGAIQDVEYWDQANLIWVSWGATGLAKVKALLDGRQDTSAPIAHANRKFRFTVTKNTGWPTKTIVVLQTTWSAISYTTATVSIEGSTQATGGTWTLRDTSVFSSANSGNNWGIHAKVTSSLHTGEVYNRITIDITDWVDSTTYTTYPLIGFSIYSNYSGSPQDPWSWNYDKVINFQAVPTVLNNPVLTSENFNTYALPLTGGTLTGDLILNSIDAKIKLNDTSGSPIDQSMQLRAEAIDANLPGGEGLGLILETTSTNGSPDTTPAFIVTGEIYAGNATITNTNKVWHAGNDGSGSTLDADLLDGQQGSYYLDWTNVTNKPDPQITVTLTGDVTGTANTTLTDLANGTVSVATTVAAIGSSTLATGTADSTTYLRGDRTWATVTLPSGQTAGSSTAGYLQYSGTTKTDGQLYGGTTAPSNATRLNFDGHLHATKFFGDGSNLTGLTTSVRVVTGGSSGTLTINSSTTDIYSSLALTGDITLAQPSGTPTDGQKLIIRLRDDGTSRSIAWTDTSGAFRALGTILPTATTISKIIYVGCLYNGTDSFWDVIAVTTEE